MKSIQITLLFLLWTSTLFAQQTPHPIHTYLIPGMGTDHRVFNDYQFDSTLIDVETIKWVDTDSTTTLSDYAQLLANQIDTTVPFILVGVSMGGMLAMELSQIVHPEAVVLISSVRSSKHLPLKAKAGKVFPAHRLLTEKILQKIVSQKRWWKDIHRESHRQLYRTMLLDTGAEFLQWQINAIANWTFTLPADHPPIFHIHGNKDNVLPLNKLDSVDHIIKGGTHKMVINRSDELIVLIEQFVNGKMLTAKVNR